MKGNHKSKEFIERLPILADEYIQECLANTKEVVSNSKGVVKVKDRHIPTIGYFLRIWLPLIKKEETCSRQTYYVWLDLDDDTEEARLKTDTIKKIDNMFKELATDIVANEGKGIFYAKNRLGMSDRQETKNDNKITVRFKEPGEE